jgi:ATP-dependent Lon protease
MNPIIFIDEVYKISNTEHGKEIIGILTHLLDPTQNDSFQDKYFSGIDLDLSKALFILSYNNVNAIDSILLDRIHRVKFNNLSLEDKLVIVKNHILPEIYTKMGLDNMITFENDEVIKYIIQEYTLESGVRKLKEILFEIVGEININSLNKKYNVSNNYNYPIVITINDIKNNYFKDKKEISKKKIHPESQIGVINGLWANSLGNGGIIPIQATFFPSSSFLELKLTGMQGDVMKESMNVALTLAWKLTDEKIRSSISEKYNNNKQYYGVHIHCPEGSVPKDGPSAGTAITTVLYSLFNNIKIKNIFALTGEISLDSCVTEIGGLDLKIIGGIKAGIQKFIYPVENKKEFNDFMEKYKESELIKDIHFYPVSKVQEVFELIFEKN